MSVAETTKGIVAYSVVLVGMLFNSIYLSSMQ